MLWITNATISIFHPIPEKCPAIESSSDVEPDPGVGGSAAALACFLILISLCFLLPGFSEGVFWLIGCGLIVVGGGIAMFMYSARAKKSHAGECQRLNETARIEVDRLNKQARAEAEQFNRNRIIVTDAEIDEVVSNYFKDNLKSMALHKLGVDEEQVQEISPIHIGNYYFNDIPTASSVKRKTGKDGRNRASHYEVLTFLFSADQVYCYRLRFSLLEGKKQETTDEYFYRDIVSVSADSVGDIYEFKLTTSGGTSIGTTVFDFGAAERSVQDMRRLLRIKKQQT
ncbi:MAG: hypothetical protein FWE95_09025 [Planctomycetaceae bacterium]|nr:hypothetical protein [Planctomycetaceae bacterium]